jgi:hypothetical protein
MEVERNEGKANKERAQERLVRREEGGGEVKVPYTRKRAAVENGRLDSVVPRLSGPHYFPLGWRTFTRPRFASFSMEPKLFLRPLSSLTPLKLQCSGLSVANGSAEPFYVLP